MMVEDWVNPLSHWTLPTECYQQFRQRGHVRQYCCENGAAKGLTPFTYRQVALKSYFPLSDLEV